MPCVSCSASLSPCWWWRWVWCIVITTMEHFYLAAIRAAAAASRTTTSTTILTREVVMMEVPPDLPLLHHPSAWLVEPVTFHCSGSALWRPLVDLRANVELCWDCIELYWKYLAAALLKSHSGFVFGFFQCIFFGQFVLVHCVLCIKSNYMECFVMEFISIW